MKLEHTFTVPVPVDKAWEVLLDLQRVAPCMPGATLTGVEGDEFTGTVKVKLGPISLTYSGKGRFVERDEAAHRVVVEASGRDTRSAGTAGPRSPRNSVGQGEETLVDVVTDLTRHRQAGPVRPGHDLRRQRQAARPVRRLPGRQAGRRATSRGGRRSGRRRRHRVSRPTRDRVGGRAGPGGRRDRHRRAEVEAVDLFRLAGSTDAARRRPPPTGSARCCSPCSRGSCAGAPQSLICGFAASATRAERGAAAGRPR